MAKLKGVTRDRNGDPLGSVDVFVVKISASSGTFVGHTTSDPSTGEWELGGIADTDAQYAAYYHKAGSPNVFDVTDRNLQPVSEA